MSSISPQAVGIPSFMTSAEYIANPPAYQFDVDNQGIIDGDTQANIINSGKGPYYIPQDRSRQIAKRFIQNIGTDPILVHVGGYDSNDVVSATNFEIVLAGGSADNDGLGSQVDLSQVKGRVSLLVASGTIRASIFQAYRPETAFAKPSSPTVIPPVG